ncbi:MAG: diadenylate cyclase [Desulfococcaceae bacterium]
MGFLTSFLYSIQWQDIIDILLNSYILFRIYILFRGTPIVLVLLVLTALQVVQVMAMSLGLVVTSWVIRGITAVATLIIVVVFRNEIRSVFTTHSLKSIFWGLPERRHATPDEIIADAVFEMGRQRIGALLVFPNKDDLKEIVENGIPWNGTITREMLISIFWHDNPVHDGAAIVRGDRIPSVGAILPLTRRKDLPSRYGTRHRAALGLSEVSDAMMIVVSEERGEVSVVKNFTIQPVPDRDALIGLLQDHSGITATGAGFFQREKIRTGLAALLSLFFVFTVWYQLTRGSDTLVSLEVPLEFYNRAPDMEIIDTSVHTVQLYLSGSGQLIQSLKPEQLTVRLDLAQLDAGENILPVDLENITTPPGILLRRVEPSSVQLFLDKIAEKEVPVQVTWAGELDPNLIITDAEVDPPKVRVRGGHRLIDRITTLYTEPVDLNGITSSDTITVPLQLEPAGIKLAPGSKEKVRVTYEVRTRTPGPAPALDASPKAEP